GVSEHRRAIRLDMLVETQAERSLSQDRSECGFAHLERLATEVVAIQFNQIEGVEEDSVVMPPIADAVEVRHPVVVTGDRLTVDDTGARAQAEQRLDDKRKALGQAVAWTAVEPHMIAVPARHEAKAVVLDLMQPDRPRGRAVGLRGQAWGDEAGRQD